MSLGEIRPQTGVIGLFHFENNSNDSSGSSNNGTDTDITYSQANGKFNLGAGFNGTSSKIVLPAGLIGFTTSLTISGWVSCTDFVTQRFVLSSDSGNGFLFYFYTDGKAHGALNTVSGFSDLPNSVASTAGEDIFLGMTYNGSTFSFYVNGVLANSASKTGNITYAETNKGAFGSYNLGAPWHKGFTDEFVFSNLVKPADWFRKQYSLGRFGEL